MQDKKRAADSVAPLRLLAGRPEVKVTPLRLLAIQQRTTRGRHALRAAEHERAKTEGALLASQRRAEANADLIEDVAWMTRNGTSLSLAAERLEMTSDELRHRLEGLGQDVLLAKLRREIP